MASGADQMPWPLCLGSTEMRQSFCTLMPGVALRSALGLSALSVSTLLPLLAISMFVSVFPCVSLVVVIIWKLSSSSSHLDPRENMPRFLDDAPSLLLLSPYVGGALRSPELGKGLELRVEVNRRPRPSHLTAGRKLGKLAQPSLCHPMIVSQIVNACSRPSERDTYPTLTSTIDHMKTMLRLEVTSVEVRLMLIRTLSRTIETIETKHPREKMPARTIRWESGACSSQTYGIGRTSRNTSVTTLGMEAPRYTDLVLTQVLSVIVMSHWAETGLQVNMRIKFCKS